MFGLSIIKTKRLRKLWQQIDEKEATILLHERTIIDLRRQVEELTPKRDSNGRYTSKN